MKLKRLLLLLFSGFSLLTCTTCNKEFNPDDQWKDITVVYGLIDLSSSVQYMRINKAFLGPDNAIHMASIPDSSLYPVDDIDVMISEFDGTGKEINVTMLDTVIITNKDSGIFYYPDQPVYALKQTFDPIKTGDHTFRIDVTNKKTGKLVYATTPVVNRFTITIPANGSIVDFNPIKKETSFQWKKAVNGKRYDVFYTFYYGEAPAGTNDIGKYSRDSVVWHIGSVVANNETDFIFYFSPLAFYGAIQSNIPYDPSVWRISYSMNKIDFWCGSNELYEYIQINNPATGIIQERPEYTNLYSKTGDEQPKHRNDAFGLFSSRFHQKINVFISLKMREEYLPSEEYTNRQFVYFP